MWSVPHSDKPGVKTSNAAGNLLLKNGITSHIIFQLNTATTKDKLLHFSYHFSLFLTVSVLFKCRFVA